MSFIADFECPPKHGLFVLQSKAKKVGDSASTPKSLARNFAAAAPKSRLPSKLAGPSKLPALRSSAAADAATTPAVTAAVGEVNSSEVVAALQQELDAAKAELADKNSTVDKLSTEVAAQSQKITELAHAATSAAEASDAPAAASATAPITDPAAVELLRNELETVRGELAHLVTEKTEVFTSAEGLKHDLAESVAKLDQVSTAKDEATTALSEMAAARYAAVAAAKAELAEQLTVAKAETATALSEMAAANDAAVAKVKTELAVANDEAAAALKAALVKSAGFESNVVELTAAAEARHKSVESDKDTIAAELAQRTEECAKLRQESDALKEQVGSYERSAADGGGELQALRTSLSESQSKVQALGNNEAKQAEVLAASKHRCAELTKAAAEAAEARLAAGAEKTDADSKIAEQQRLLDELAHTLKAAAVFEATASAQAQEIEAAKESAQGLTAEITVLSGKNSASEKELSDSKARVQDLEVKLGSQRNTHAKAMDDIKAAAAGTSDEAAMKLQADMAGLQSRLDDQVDSAARETTRVTAEAERSISKLNIELELRSAELSDSKTRALELAAQLAAEVEGTKAVKNELQEAGSNFEDQAGQLADIAKAKAVADARAEQLATELASSKADLVHLVEEVATMNSAIGAKTSRVAELEVDVTKLRAELGAAQTARAHLETEASSQSSMAASVAAELVLVKDRLKATSEELALLQTRLAVDQHALKVAQQDLASAQKAASEGSVTSAASADEVRSVKGDLASLAAKLAAATAEVGSLTAKTTESSIELERLHTQLTGGTSELKALREQLEARSEELVAKSDALATETSKATAAAEKAAAGVTTLASMKVKLEVAEERLGKATKQKVADADASTKVALASAQSECAAKQKELVSMTVKLEVAEELLKSTRAKVTALETSADTRPAVLTDADIAELREQLIQKDEMLALAEIQLDDANAGIDEAADQESERFELLAENSMLKRRLVEIQSELRALKDEVAAAKSETATAHAAVAAAKNGMDEVMDGEDTGAHVLGATIPSN